MPAGRHSSYNLRSYKRPLFLTSLPISTLISPRPPAIRRNRMHYRLCPSLLFRKVRWSRSMSFLLSFQVVVYRKHALRLLPVPDQDITRHENFDGPEVSLTFNRAIPYSTRGQNLCPKNPWYQHHVPVRFSRMTFRIYRYISVQNNAIFSGSFSLSWFEMI